MKKYRVVLSAKALQELREIYEYISANYGEWYAVATEVRIRRKIAALETGAKGYTVIEDTLGVRSVRVRHYRIFFEVLTEDRVVNITHIAYARRDLKKILGEEM